MNFRVRSEIEESKEKRSLSLSIYDRIHTRGKINSCHFPVNFAKQGNENLDNVQVIKREIIMKETGDCGTEISYERAFSSINQQIYREEEIAVGRIIAIRAVLKRQVSFRLIHFTKNLQPRSNEAAIRKRGNKKRFSYRARAVAPISFPAIELPAKIPIVSHD